MKTGFHSHFYANFHASVTANFVQIFMKFSPKCRTKKLGNFAHFLIGKGPIFFPKSGLGKSMVLAIFVGNLVTISAKLF